MTRTIVDGRRLEVERLDGAHDRTAIVLLHEGLGSVSLWRDWPALLRGRTGRTVVAYSRYGYGRSDVLTESREPDYMHHEGEQVLPALLDALGLARAILFGHSDGASIALIAAATHPQRVAALVLEAPHVFVEDVGIRSIEAARHAFRDGPLRERLGRHHDDPAATFAGWNDIWLDERFRSWNIEAYAARVGCPVLLVQGSADEYGTEAQLQSIAARAAGTRTLLVADAGHSPHRDAPETVLAAVAAFVEPLP